MFYTDIFTGPGDPCNTTVGGGGLAYFWGYLKQGPFLFRAPLTAKKNTQKQPSNLNNIQQIYQDMSVKLQSISKVWHFWYSYLPPHSSKTYDSNLFLPPTPANISRHFSFGTLIFSSSISLLSPDDLSASPDDAEDLPLPFPFPLPLPCKD